MLQGLSMDDVSMYYRDCFFEHKGRVGYLHEVRASKKEDTFNFHMQDVRNGEEFTANTSEINFEYPKMGYVDLGDRGGVVLAKRIVDRGYKKGVRTRNITFCPAVNNPLKTSGRILNTHSRHMYHMFFPTFIGTEHLSSRLGSKKSSTRKLFPLSHSFCAMNINNSHVLAYNGFIVGEVVEDNIKFHSGCEFLREKMIEEVRDVRFV